MVEGNHWDQWFSDGFGVRQPLVTMGFNGCAPLVWGWNGYVPSSKSIVVLFLAPLEIDLAPTEQDRRTRVKSGRPRQTKPIQSVTSLRLNTVYNGGSA